MCRRLHTLQEHHIQQAEERNQESRQQMTTSVTVNAQPAVHRRVRIHNITDDFPLSSEAGIIELIANCVQNVRHI